LYEAKVGAGVEQMRRDAVLEDMKVLLFWRKIRHGAIRLHEPIQSPSGNRVVAVTREENGRFVITLAQVRFDGLGFVRLERMLARIAAFEPVNHDAQLLKVQITGAKQADFAGAQSVTIGDEEDRLITFVFAQRACAGDLR
jgi:hypothetical protein